MLDTAACDHRSPSPASRMRGFTWCMCRNVASGVGGAGADAVVEGEEEAGGEGPEAVLDGGYDYGTLEAALRADSGGDLSRRRNR